MAESTQLKTLSQSILKALLYYDIFLYPLTPAEIFRYLSTNHVTEEDVTEDLHHLANQSLIYRVGDFYSVQNKIELGSRRSHGNALASGTMNLARRQAGKIAKFPFVRGVLVSGSLAKGFMDKDSDLDFFIVTEPGRLWIARTLLVTYKKVFLFNSHKNFCVNYFVDANHLEIEEKNLFTAIELATLLPLHNDSVYSQLIEKNSWIKSYFPNYTQRPVTGIGPVGKFIMRGFFETLINIFADRLEPFFKNLTLRRWRNRYQKYYSSVDFQVAFKTETYVSKGHPNNYQRKVMEMYDQKLKTFAGLHQLTWGA